MAPADEEQVQPARSMGEAVETLETACRATKPRESHKSPNPLRAVIAVTYTPVAAWLGITGEFACI